MAPQQQRVEPPVEPRVSDTLTSRERAVINIAALVLQHCREAALDLHDLRDVVNDLIPPRPIGIDERTLPLADVVHAFEAPAQQDASK